MSKLETPKPIGIFAKYRLEYLQDENPKLYRKLLESGDLMAHLQEIEEKAQAVYEADKKKTMEIVMDDLRWPTMPEVEKKARRRIVHECAIEMACNDVVWI